MVPQRSKFKVFPCFSLKHFFLWYYSLVLLFIWTGFKDSFQISRVRALRTLLLTGPHSPLIISQKVWWAHLQRWPFAGPCVSCAPCPQLGSKQKNSDQLKVFVWSLLLELEFRSWLKIRSCQPEQEDRCVTWRGCVEAAQGQFTKERPV